MDLAIQVCDPEKYCMVGLTILEGSVCSFDTGHRTHTKVNTKRVVYARASKISHTGGQ
jgi:hypothetical protein